MQMICIWFSWCHCHSIVFCCIKIQNGFTFLVPTYPGCSGIKAVKWLSVCFMDMFWVHLRGQFECSPFFRASSSSWDKPKLSISFWHCPPKSFLPFTSHHPAYSFHQCSCQFSLAVSIRVHQVWTGGHCLLGSPWHCTSVFVWSALQHRWSTNKKLTSIIYFQTSWRPPFTTSHCRWLLICCCWTMALEQPVWRCPICLDTDNFLPTIEITYFGNLEVTLLRPL